MWEECEKIVSETWSKEWRAPTLLANTKEKIGHCGVELLAWGSSRTHPDAKEIKTLQKHVEKLSVGIISEESKAEFLVASKKLDDLLLQQEIYWAQRSRVNWLKHGDRNTKFFHSKASQRRRKNFIKGVKDQQDNWVEDIEDIAGVVTNYFETIFEAGDYSRMEECLSAIPQKVTMDMQEILSREFSADEIKATLFQMGPTKAPGPDGMNALFYQKFWHIVGNDVTAAALDFLNSGNMVPKINYTHIVLIPKVKSLEKISNYRPISLCNVIYKIISKVMANRLKQILPHVISPS